MSKKEKRKFWVLTTFHGEFFDTRVEAEECAKKQRDLYRVVKVSVKKAPKAGSFRP